MTGILSHGVIAAMGWVWSVSAVPGGSDDLLNRRVYEVMPVPTAPRIDGRLDDPCWSTAPIMGQFTLTLTGAGPAVDAPTEARLVYKGRFLYIAVTCHEPHPERILRRITAHDVSAVCGDDAIEVFIHPDPTTDVYYQLAASAIGTRYDGCRFDGSWNGTWQARARVGPRAWTLELAVDLASLGRLPQPGQVWGFNMDRERPSATPRQYQCWSDTGGPFHTPERFGRIVFGGAFAGLRRVELIESARWAVETLELERRIVASRAVIDRMWASLPADQRRRYAETHTRLTKTWQDLHRAYTDRPDLTVAQWSAFTQALRRVADDADRIAWACRFHQLLNE